MQNQFSRNVMNILPELELDGIQAGQLGGEPSESNKFNKIHWNEFHIEKLHI